MGYHHSPPSDMEIQFGQVSFSQPNLPPRIDFVGKAERGNPVTVGCFLFLGEK